MYAFASGGLLKRIERRAEVAIADRCKIAVVTAVER